MDHKAGGKLKRLCKECPFNGTCGTSLQRKVKADLWVLPSNMIFAALPEAIPAESLRWAIVDEDPTQYATFGGGVTGAQNGNEPELLPLNSALEMRRIPDQEDPSRDDHDLTADFDAATGMLRAALSDEGERIRTSNLVAAGMAVDLAMAAESAAWRLRGILKISGAMSDEAIISAADVVTDINGAARKLAALWGAIRRALACDVANVPGILRVEMKTAGGKVPALDLMWRKSIGAALRVPTMLMDATADPKLAAAVFECVPSVWTSPNAALGSAVRVRQVWDRSFGSSMLAPPDLRGMNAVNAARNNIKKLFWYIEIRARQFHGQGDTLTDGTRPDVLLLGQKQVIERLRALGLPENVEVEHFGNFAGRDRWSGVRCLIVIGRRMPRPEAVERIAEVLDTCDVKPVRPWYSSSALALRLRDSETGHTVKTERHDDPLAEAIRWRIAEGEIVQGIGRPRGVRRNDDTPLQIDIFGRAPFPGIEVDELVLWRDASAPSIGDHLLARWGIVPPPRRPHGMSDIIAELLPDRFNNGKAVRDWLSAGGRLSLSESSNRILIEDSDTEDLIRGTYKTTPEKRYSVQLVRFGNLPPPLTTVGDTVAERRTFDLLGGYSWRPKDEVISEQRAAAALWASAQRAGISSWPSLFGNDDEVAET